MMLLISIITAGALYFAQHQLASNVEQDLKAEFQSRISSLHSIEELRHSALAERCRTLAQNARLHAALEDDAMDLLYPSAQDELRDTLEPQDEANEAHPLYATFYRFIDATGAVVVP